ncbi:hypothetical protein [Parasitella parasitica]|uniref:EF-hand domain-containing protein n=1 Tax=Parasitella parasitica TaxID=35722 RepID=A0A0B7MWM3_9FUNG|nr:hypothetical protein [Parasitella parasitica]
MHPYGGGQVSKNEGLVRICIYYGAYIQQQPQQGLPYLNNNPYRFSVSPSQQQQYQHNTIHRQSAFPSFNTPQSLQQNSYNQTTPLQRSNTFTPAVDRREQYLWDIFQRVDADKSGSISVYELQSALVNGDWSPFNIETVRMMVGIFDTDNNGTIDFREFRGLWKYVEDWSHCFKKFDQDNSGSIDCYEMSYALRTFGYNVSDRFTRLLIQTFDKYGNGDITFDNFVQACVTLSSLTKSFRAKDFEVLDIGDK